MAQDVVPAPGPTLTSLLARGELACGVSQSDLGFGYLDPNTGEVSGFSIDLCRALAAAVFGDVAAVRFEPYSTVDDGLLGLRSSAVDVLFFPLPPNSGLDALDLDFGPPMFYSGQSLLTRLDGPTSWAAMNGRSVCVISGSTAEALLPAQASRQGITLQILPQPTREAAWAALEDGTCDAQSDDFLQLAILRQTARDPQGYLLWPDREGLYTQEPYVPVFRGGDDQWAAIVRWTMWGLLQAEQLGITSENVDLLARQTTGTGDNVAQETDPRFIQRVGQDIANMIDPGLGIGGRFALAPDFMAAVIRDLGNYGEIFNRHFGLTGNLPLERSLNQLWSAGGLFFAPNWQ